MKGISKLSYKTLIFLVIAALVFPTVLYVFAHRQENRPSALGDLEGSVEQIVADISNLTGASSEEITQLKQSGLSWNQILERLKLEKGSYTQEREARSSLLTEENMEETVIKLRSAGFSDEDIQGAKLMTERVEFQLREIVGTSATPSSPAIPVAGELEPKGDDLKKEVVQRLAEKYDSASAVYYLLTLKEGLGDTSTVMDEYLLSLQFDLDLQLYMDDRDTYLKSKEIKTAGYLPDSIVTVAYIEELLLEEINQRAFMDSGHSTTPSAGISQNNSTAPEEVSIDLSSESFSVPEVPNVNPVNPSEQIQQELDALNPNLP